jgi:hypothetical protein
MERQIGPASHRWVSLIDGQSAERVLVQACLYRDIPAHFLDDLEEQWTAARERAASGLASLEHAHWDWRNKAHSVETGVHMLIAVERNGDWHGVMAVQRTPLRSRLGDGHVVYVDYLETAPWNLRRPGQTPQFLGVGTALIAEAVRLGVEEGLEGRVGCTPCRRPKRFTRGSA